MTSQQFNVVESWILTLIRAHSASALGVEAWADIFDEMHKASAAARAILCEDQEDTK